MAIRDELKSNLDRVTESTAFHAVAGAGDLAAEKIRQVPAKLAELDLPGKIDQLQDRLTALKVDPKDMQARAQDVQAKAQSKARELPERVTDLAMQLTGKAVQTYGELAQRGKAVVDRRRGVIHDADLPIKTEVVREPVTPVVEQVTPVTPVAPASPVTKPVTEAAKPAVETPKPARPAKPAATKAPESKVPTARKTPGQSKAKGSAGKSSKS